MPTPPCTDLVVFNLWHQLPTLVRYGYIWTSLGTPPKDLSRIPEYDEPDRCNMNASTIGVHVSAARAIENFLDMAHFPFVHTDVLGSEPHPEVVEYDRQDVIAVFLQPVDQEHVRAHLLLPVLDDAHEAKEIRNFQQSIFGQDKPILKNQFPKRLPLHPRSETPIRADKPAVVYRRWLSGKGITYGVIPGGEVSGDAQHPVRPHPARRTGPRLGSKASSRCPGSSRPDRPRHEEAVRSDLGQTNCRLSLACRFTSL